MDASDRLRELKRAGIERMKALGGGIKIGQVLGDRVLVKTVIPYTDIDRVEKEGILAVPDHLKKEYTPLPSTGVVVQIGTGVDPHLIHETIGTDGGTASPLLEIGTMVMFSRFAGSDASVDEEHDYRILDTNEILCTLIDTESAVVPVKGDEREV